MKLLPRAVVAGCTDLRKSCVETQTFPRSPQSTHRPLPVNPSPEGAFFHKREAFTLVERSLTKATRVHGHHRKQGVVCDALVRCLRNVVFAVRDGVSLR